MKHFFISILCFLNFAVQLSAQKPEPPKDSSGTQIKLYGFITLDATYDFQNLGKSDVLKPSDIPVQPNGSDPAFFMSAKQTRLGMQLTKETPLGAIKGVLEVDFHNTADQSNGLPRIRHAFIQWKGLTAGQAWSTFTDIEGRPQTVDYQGPATGTFNRVPLIRYDFTGKSHIWSVALEDPIEEISANQVIKVKKQTLPDVVTSYKVYWNSRKSFLRLGLLGRQLKYTTIDSTQTAVNNARLYGWGAIVIGKLTLPGGNTKDNIKFEALTGNGLAHYMAGTTGLSLDAAFNAKMHRPADIGLSGGFVSYQHYWSDKFNSTAIAGSFRVNDKALLSGNSFRSSIYTTVNLFYTPVKPLAFGLECQYATRQNINGQQGDASRIQGTAIYNF